jgi:hypothetical protein
VTSLGLSMRLTDNHVPALMRGLDWLADAWADNMAYSLRDHAQREAPVGREVYTDEEGHEHPGWLRESIDVLPLPGPSHPWLVTVHAFYGIYVNNGTRNMAPNPFWDRAVFRAELEGDDLLDWSTRQWLLRAGVR